MNRTAFYATLRPHFGAFSQRQVTGFERYLDHFEKVARAPMAHFAYILATVWHETGTRMQPVRETFADSDAQAIQRLDASWKAGKLPQVKKPYWQPDADGKAWFGRGDIQITHRANYERIGHAIGVDLIGNPSLALDPSVSLLIVWHGMTEGLFTGKKLSDFLTPEQTGWIGARRIVNGLDRAKQIAVYAALFADALRGAHV